MNNKDQENNDIIETISLLETLVKKQDDALAIFREISNYKDVLIKTKEQEINQCKKLIIYLCIVSSCFALLFFLTFLYNI